jgi:hypothetical protein
MRNGGSGEIQRLVTRRAIPIGNLQELCDNPIGLLSHVPELGLRRVAFPSILVFNAPRFSFYTLPFRVDPRFLQMMLAAFRPRLPLGIFQYRSTSA